MKGRELLAYSLAIEEQHFGAGHVETAITLNNLALSYGETGDIDTMQELLQRSLEIKDRHFGPDHVESCLTLANLAMAYGVAGETEAARAFSNRALTACSENGCGSSRRYGVVLLRAATIHLALGDVGMAESFTSRAFQIFGDVLGPVATSRVVALERSRTSRIWSTACRDDVVKWLQTNFTTDRFNTKVKCVVTPDKFPSCDSPLESPRIMQDQVGMAINKYLEIRGRGR
jgi:tetratricopeptide (TPR) repeat protein